MKNPIRDKRHQDKTTKLWRAHRLSPMAKQAGVRKMLKPKKGRVAKTAPRAMRPKARHPNV